MVEAVACVEIGLDVRDGVRSYLPHKVDYTHPSSGQIKDPTQKHKENNPK